MLPASMRYVEHRSGTAPDDMRIEHGPLPQPAADEILIRVHFAGINRPDLFQRAGKYPPPPGASPILGLEVSGEVAAIGAAVTQWQVGDQVTALTPGGGYAEYCVAAADHALAIPAGLSLAAAAGLPENWFTVWANIMDLGRLQPGEKLLVHGGSGGIGLAGIQLGRLIGAQVFTTAGSAEKTAFCLKHGADVAINYREQDFKEAIRAQADGVDVILDMVGGDYVQKNLSLLRRGGRLVYIAFLQGSRMELDMLPIMTKQLILTGSTLRPRSKADKSAIRNALQEKVWPALAGGRITSHIDRIFDLAEAAQAHQLMASSQHMGKILLRVKEGA